MKEHHVYKIPLNVKSIEIQHLCFFKSTQSVPKIKFSIYNYFKTFKLFFNNRIILCLFMFMDFQMHMQYNLVLRGKV